MRSEKDWRVRTALINSMYWYGYSIAYTTYMRGLSDANQHVVLATIGEMTKYGSAKSIEFFLEKAKLETRPIISTAYYAAALKLCPVKARDTKINISQILIEKYKASKDLYEQGSILDALTGYADNYKFIKEQTFARDAKPVIKSYGIEALVKLRRNPEFGYSFGKGQREAVRILDSLFQMAILTGDPALTAVASEVLRDSTMGFRERLVNDPRFLSDGQRKLKLPRDIEAYNELQKTIDHFTYKKTPTKKVDYNHSIDYAVLNELSATPTAIIKTAKGEIELKLFPQIAPGSVANFVKLANAGFFNNKVFHRVVPNFVVQGGCPRGDGWGSQDFTIRSEFSIQAHYDDAGWVGMASAGKDTESSQWFITHSPTPHLDGRYSIFAKVIKGMDTVDKLVVGDKMTSVKIQ
jgi:cyclophilin family peptidyl-prolyl cis-trans isomerase